ncbi:hypothetical protein GCM10010344_36140 [Streptomyces bluensis]|nr:hypothetical protein GCM10010344_36140 [Streptomyces bluensis]
MRDSCLVVGIAEDEHGEGGYFIFQCGLETLDEQAQSLELDSYCILNDAGGVQYGGLNEVSLYPGRVRFHFSPEAAVELELPEQEIELGLTSGVDIESLRGGLRRVLTYGKPAKIPGILDL